MTCNGFYLVNTDMIDMAQYLEASRQGGRAENVQHRCGINSKLKDNAEHMLVLTFCEALREREDLLGILGPDEPDQVLEGLLAPLILLKWQALRWCGPLPWPATPYLHLHIDNLLLILLGSCGYSKGQGFSGFPRSKSSSCWSGALARPRISTCTQMSARLKARHSSGRKLSTPMSLILEEKIKACAISQCKAKSGACHLG